MNILKFGNGDCYDMAVRLVERVSCRYRKAIQIFGVPRGGIPVAYLVQSVLTNYGVHAEVVDSASEATLIVDDLIDSGSTMQSYRKNFPDTPFEALVNKIETGDKSWIVFPWEESLEGSASDIVIRMLQFIGEDVTRDGLTETPKRVLKSWGELFSGYTVNPCDIIKEFDNDGNYDQMILLKSIEFTSNCEHHILPFSGKAHVAYIPSAGGKIVGISKLARLVDCFAKRLQVQERLTQQIADCIEEYLKPLGVAVMIEASHSCVSCRGVGKQHSRMVTTALKGTLKNDSAARAEFYSLVKE